MLQALQSCWLWRKPFTTCGDKPLDAHLTTPPFAAMAACVVATFCRMLALFGRRCAGCVTIALLSRPTIYSNSERAGYNKWFACSSMPRSCRRKMLGCGSMLLLVASSTAVRDDSTTASVGLIQVTCPFWSKQRPVVVLWTSAALVL